MTATSVPDTAPDLFRYNPETEDSKIPGPFMDLYRRARRHFCHEILNRPSVDSPWTAALRSAWDLSSPKRHGSTARKERLTGLIDRTWNEVRPSLQQAEALISADPTLLDVHGGLAFDCWEEQVGPVDVATLNLRLWTRRSLRSFWERRLDGKLMALFGVQPKRVELKGLAPAPLLEAHPGSPTPPLDTYSS
jgi:hypothetical protein